MSDLVIVRFIATKEFAKARAKLVAKKRQQVDDTLLAALANINDPRLHLHTLMGKWLGVYSLNVGGDLRILFEAVEVPTEEPDETTNAPSGEPIVETLGVLITVGTHAQLYG